VGSHLIMRFLLASTQQLSEAWEEFKILYRPRAKLVLDVVSLHVEILVVCSFCLVHSVFESNSESWCGVIALRL
jgi:hypothetical protein